MQLSLRVLARTSLALFAIQTSGAQVLTNPSNTSTPATPVSGTDIIIFPQGTDPNSNGRILKALTTPAQLSGQQANIQIIGTLVSITTNNSNSANVNHSIALLSCDASAYPGFYDVATTFQVLFYRNPYAIILYSNSSIDSGCNLNVTDNSAYSMGMIYTTTSPQEVTMLMAQAESQAGVGFVIAQRSTADNSTGTQTSSSGSGNNGSFSSTSPSTAVAMIILYSITGVITALFLVIIITGAVRAHRHPERYGPRAGLGRRAGQSRARGLARAMLDTLPIVKFGEKEEDKDGDGTTPRDVELGGVLVAGAAGAEHDKTEDDEDSEAGSGAHATEENNGEASNTRTEAEDAILAEKPKHAADESKNSTSDVYASPEQPAQAEENLGCSICTEDFEKGQDVRVLPCKHTFHPACIDPWLLNVSGTCPLCRVDLRPTDTNNSRHSSASSAGDELPPPIEAPAEPSSLVNQRRASRRTSLMWDIREVLNPRTMRNASAQERIEALRSVREQGVDDDARRRRRLTARLHDVFSVKTFRRGRSPLPAEESEDVETGASNASASGLQRGVRGSVIEEPEPISETPATMPAAEPLTGHTEVPVEHTPVETQAEVSDPVPEQSQGKVAEHPKESAEAPEEVHSTEPGPSSSS